MARILVIDDEDAVRVAIRHALELEGHIIAEAANGEEALAMVADVRPDITITDILMPDMDGIETMLELRKRDPNIVVLAISGGGQIGNAEFLEVARLLGANSVLEKPFEISELRGAVDALQSERSGKA